MLYSLTMFSKLCLSGQTAMRKRLFSIVFAGLFLALVTDLSLRSPAIAKPVILNCSRIAGPGDIVNLQGHDLDGATAVMCSVNDGAAESLTIVNRGNNVLHVKVSSQAGLYAITVQNHGDASNTVFPNRANPMHFDTTTVASGGIFRIFGRNLSAPNFTPRVYLLGEKGSYDATISGASKFNELSVCAPKNIPIGRYRVAVNNGMCNRSSGTSAAPYQMEISSIGPDTFKIETPWCSDLKFGDNVFNVKNDPRLRIHSIGNGKTNDQPAIQAAIVAANESGGGVVFLPEGYYLLASDHGAQLEFKSNVVLRGQNRTFTRMCYGKGKPSKDFVFARFYNVTKCGLCDISIENLNENDSWLNTKSITNEGGKIDRVFLARVSYQIKNGFRVELKGDHIAIEECVLESDYSTLHLGTCTNSIVKRNSLSQKFGVNLDMTETKNCVVDSNLFWMNANNGFLLKGNVRHGIAIGFAHDLAIVHNEFDATNGALSSNNDGESILSEGGGGSRPGEETGEKTSKYAIFRWSNRNTTIADNKFKRLLRGIWTYQGSTTDMQVSGNDIRYMDGIFFEPCQNLLTKNGQFNPVWNTTVDHNVLRSQPVNRPELKSTVVATHINFTGDLQQTSSLVGTMALNDQIYGNTIFWVQALNFSKTIQRIRRAIATIYVWRIRYSTRMRFLPCLV